jgi:hypothetical protein
VQRLEVLVAVMLARERRAPADNAADGCTELAVALATLPSRPLEMIAEAVAALGCADALPLARLESPTQVRNHPHCRSTGTAKIGCLCA